jgi:hypothetical protein
MNAEKIEGKLITLAKKAKDKAKDKVPGTTSVQQSTGNSEKLANDAIAGISDINDADLNTQIEAKVLQIFRKDLQKEKIKLIIKYSHDRTIIIRLFLKEASLTGSMVAYNIMNDLHFAKLIDPKDMNPISYSFIVQFISCLIAVGYLIYKTKHGDKKEVSVRKVFIIMFLITLTCYITLFLLGKTLLVYFIIQLCMLLIDFIRWYFTEIGILTDTISPEKSYNKIKIKSESDHTVTKNTKRFLGGTIIAFDTLMRGLAYLIIHPQKSTIYMSGLIDKMRGMIGGGSTKVQEQPGGGIKLGGSTLKSRFKILDKYTKLTISEVPISLNIVESLTELLKYINMLETKEDTKKGGGNKKRRYKTKRNNLLN